MVIENWRVTDVLASASLTVKVNVPSLVGVPVITPAAERFSPGGIPSAGNDHVKGWVPPVLSRFVVGYGTETSPVANVSSEIASWPASVSVSDLLTLVK